MSKTIVFYACPAFVCQVLGLRRAKVWLDWPDEAPLNYDSTKTLELDLDKSPSFGDGAVEVDDTLTVPNGGVAGLTTLGPRWPLGADGGIGNNGEGSVWLEESVWKYARDKGLMQYPPRIGTKPPLNLQHYRWQSLLVPTAPGGPLPARRYVGVHARLEQLSGSQATFAVWRATEDPSSSNFRTVTVDLDSVDQVHAPAVVTTMGTWQHPRAIDEEGPLFLSLDLALFFIPKLPLGQGH